MFGGSPASRPVALASAKIDASVCVSETYKSPEASVRSAGHEKYSPCAPNTMSCEIVGGVVPVSTSITCAHDRVVESPAGTQAADAEVHNWPFRHVASRSRLSPESIVPPSVAEAGGAFCTSIVRFVAEASVTFPPSGVPVILITFNVVAALRVVRYWSFAEESNCAGRTVKRPALNGKLQNPRFGLGPHTEGVGAADSRSAFSNTTECSPQ